MPAAQPPISRAGIMLFRTVRATCLLLALLLLCQLAAGPGGAWAGDISALAVVGPDRRADFQVEVAEGPAEQARGLMYRRNLAPDSGMLFPFAEARQARFWMRNTYVPLDLLFIDEAGRIESIHADAAPLDESTIASRGPVIAVLEILAGESARRGIRPGDRVLHPALPAPPPAGDAATQDDPPAGAAR